MNFSIIVTIILILSILGILIYLIGIIGLGIFYLILIIIDKILDLIIYIKEYYTLTGKDWILKYDNWWLQ